MSTSAEKKAKRVRYQHELMALGDLDDNLHYGSFASQWWSLSSKGPIPLRLNMWTRSLINSKTESGQMIDLYITKHHESMLPAYRALCRGIETSAQVAEVTEFSSTKAVNDCLKQYSYLNDIQLSGSKLPGPEFIGLGVENIEFQLQNNVEIKPVVILVDALNIFVTSLPLRLFASSFFGKSHQGKAFYVQKIQRDTYRLEIYSECGYLINSFAGHNATEVWSQASANPFFPTYNADDLFGFNNKTVCQMRNSLTCNRSSWENENIMQSMYIRYLSHSFGKDLFLRLKKELIQCESVIVNYDELLENAEVEWQQLSQQQKSALKQFLVAIGCTEIDDDDDDNIVYWGISGNSKKDIATFTTLKTHFYQSVQSDCNYETDISDKFWKCFKTSIEQNKREYEGKTRILSIIANSFTYSELTSNLNVSFEAIYFISLSY